MDLSVALIHAFIFPDVTHVTRVLYEAFSVHSFGNERSLRETAIWSTPLCTE